jgi:hypothetical protein
LLMMAVSRCEQMRLTSPNLHFPQLEANDASAS